MKKLNTLIYGVITIFTFSVIFMMANTSFAKGEGIHSFRTQEVILSQGKIIEIAFASIDGGKEEQLSMEYFPKILPIVERYGGKMLGSFQVTAVTSGEIYPQMIAIFEWPSLEAQKKLFADEEAQKLFLIRDDAVTAFKAAYYTVEEDTTITFRGDRTYEFFNAWLTPEAETALPEYFVQSEAPKQKYGPPEFLVKLKPYDMAPQKEHVLHPEMAGIVEWKSTGSYYGLIADPDFKKVAPLLEQSMRRIDMVHAKVNIPKEMTKKICNL